MNTVTFYIHSSNLYTFFNGTYVAWRGHTQDNEFYLQFTYKVEDVEFEGVKVKLKRK